MSATFQIPDEILRIAAETSAGLLPEKLRSRYEHEYGQFCEWRERKKIKGVSDDVLLVYLSEKSKGLKCSTLWSRFSMIKSCLAAKENIDVNKFQKSVAFLKRQSVGYTPKKAKILTGEQVTQFMCEASDEKWLLIKVLVLFGIFGACRRDDLIHLSVDDVEDNGRFLVVCLRDGKTHRSRSFVITDDGCPFQPCSLYRKYISLRPVMESRRLFVAYRNGRFYAQHVGCHSIAGVPRQIAQYLHLKDPQEYTGHSLRRSSASMLMEGGSDLLMLKKHGGWRSSATAEGYIEESLQRKNEASKKLFNHTTTYESPVTTASTPDQAQSAKTSVCTVRPTTLTTTSMSEETISVSQDLPAGFNCFNNTNCTINVRFYSSK